MAIKRLGRSCHEIAKVSGLGRMRGSELKGARLGGSWVSRTIQIKVKEWKGAEHCETIVRSRENQS